MGLFDILKEYADPSAVSPANVGGHFEAVAQQASQSQLGSGIAAALRSDATGSFGQTIGSLFGQSNPDQQAGLLNHLIQSIGPAALSSVGGGALGRILGSGVTTGQVSPAQAAQVSPADVSALASHAQQQDESIVDRVGGFYAQHPALVKTLGVAALGVVMSHMNTQR